MEEFPGIHSGSHSLPMMMLPIKPSSLLEIFLVFFFFFFFGGLTFPADISGNNLYT